MTLGNLMMTDYEILELAKSCGYDDLHGRRFWVDQLLKFARVMYNKGQEEEIRRQKTGIGYVNGVLVMDEF